MEEKYCGICIFAHFPVTRKGFKPECEKKKTTFKEVIILDYNSGELREKSCEEFKHYEI